MATWIILWAAWDSLGMCTILHLCHPYWFTLSSARVSVLTCIESWDVLLVASSIWHLLPSYLSWFLSLLCLWLPLTSPNPICLPMGPLEPGSWLHTIILMMCSFFLLPQHSPSYVAIVFICFALEIVLNTVHHLLLSLNVFIAQGVWLVCSL